MDAIVYGKKEKRIQIPVGTILGVIAVFLIFLWPLLSLFVEAFIREDVGFSLRNFAEVLGDANFGKVVINSILINTGATILTATIGVIAAYIMAYTDIPFKKYLHTLLLLPLVIPSYIVTLAWMQMFLKSGIAYKLTHFDIYSYAGIILMFAVCQYPTVYLLCLRTIIICFVY